MEKVRDIFPPPEIPVPLERICIEDLRPVVPQQGETVMVLQRNAKDDRTDTSGDYGSLVPEAAQQAREHACRFFRDIFEGLSEEERATIDVMVLASDAALITPSGKNSHHKRGVETAEVVMEGLKAAMKEFSLPEEQILNQGRTVEVSELRDLRMLEETPKFVQFLVEKYGTGRGFWVAYETDAEKETRIRMGAEGPEEIAERVSYALSVREQIAREYHKAHPGRRLIMWAVSHYDAISPFVKRNIAGMDMSAYLGVDHGAGISLHIDAQGKGTCEIQGNKIEFSE